MYACVFVVLHRFIRIYSSTLIFITERRQTMLFSATETEKTKALTALALKKEPIYVGVDDNKELATVEGLEQGA